MMKSFSLRTKEELCRREKEKRCCAAAELCGIIAFAWRNKGGEKKVSSETKCVIERLLRLISECFGTAPTLHEGKSYAVYLSEASRLAERIYEAAGATDAEEFVPSDKILQNACCRGAFLRGAFLGGGTVIDPNKNYNLEIVTSSEKLCDFLDRATDAAGLEFKRTSRKGSAVLYAKNSETICDMLTIIGAYSSQMEMLNVKIEREVRNDLNRAANSETANMDKVITAAAKQLRAIGIIEERMGLESLPEELHETARLRAEYKDLSLEALGKRMNPPLTKSGVNHRLKKIIDIADRL